MSVLSNRLKQARLNAGLSQEALGVAAGIDEMSASARMNQYERGKHHPDFQTVERIAKALKYPVEYFFSQDEEVARMLIGFHALDQRGRAQTLRFVEALVTETQSAKTKAATSKT